jgi:hypothetical protein
METAEREAEIKAHARPRLGEFNSAVRNVLNGMSQSHAKPKKVMNFLCGVYEPLGIEVLPFQETGSSGYYTVTEIAELLEIYSDTGNPHGHAVSAIISKLGNAGLHAIAVPYGLVGVSMRYGSHIVEAVRSWVKENDYPRAIPHEGFYYRVNYDYQFSMFNYDGTDGGGINIDVEISVKIKR